MRTDGEAVLFLDIDGCLNQKDPYPNGYCGIRWLNVENLNRILEETNAKIVISSAWRYMILGGSMNVAGFANLLMSHGVDCHGRIEGYTYPDEELPTRGLQIRHWMNEFGNGREYAIIDDGGVNRDGSWYDMDINMHHNGRVTWIDGDKGLTDEDADKVIKILKGTGSANTPSHGSRTVHSDGDMVRSCVHP